MAASPQLKVFTKQGEYVASCKYAEDAAAIVALYGHGASIRLGRSKRASVWREGDESFFAGESFDRVAEVVDRRVAYITKHAPGELERALIRDNPAVRS